MGKHYRGKHRLIKDRPVRTRIGVGTAGLALVLTGGFLASPIAVAQPASTDVALQAYSVPMAHPTNNRRDDHHNDGDRNRRGPIHFRAPIRRGHWDNVCGPHRTWSPRLHRTIVINSCSRLWRNW
jgi:hypothetical protein